MPSHAKGHPASAAQAIIKRRDKPFKPPHAVRKPASEFSFTDHAPPGYIYLPIGTPDLAQRCKQLSKERGVPMYRVNESRIRDQDKVSAHVHLSGYHFAAVIAEEACEELGYMPQDGNFVKVEDFQKELRNSEIAKTLAKYNVPTDVLISKNQGDEEKARVAIRELFPDIPDEDLAEVIKHAWSEGSDRVGTQRDIPLHRRVQLAVIATIRHKYTDYDRLLKAFDWSTARASCEADCLKKLIEWRGESSHNDPHLVEIIRDTLVEDDRDDTRRKGEHTDISDSSDGQIHRVAHAIGDDSDTVPEVTDSKQSRKRVRNYRPSRHDDPRATARAKEMLQAAYESRPSVPEAITPVFVPPNQRGEISEEIVVDGQRYRRVSAGPVSSMKAPLNNGACTQLDPVPTIHTGSPAASWQQSMSVPYNGNNTALRSIEQVSPTPPLSQSYPIQYSGHPQLNFPGPDDHANKRRRTSEHNLHQQVIHSQHHLATHGAQAGPPPFVMQPPSPMPSGELRVTHLGTRNSSDTELKLQTRHLNTPPPPAPYDPEHPLLEVSGYRRQSMASKSTTPTTLPPHGYDHAGQRFSATPGIPVHGAPAPVQQVQVVYRNPDGSYSMPARPQMRTRPQGRTVQAPVPVDGAPAPTQFWTPHPHPPPPQSYPNPPRY